MLKTTVIENFSSRNDAFDWVMSKLNDAVIGDMTTDSKFRGNDAIIGECDEFIYVGLYNIGSC